MEHKFDKSGKSSKSQEVELLDQFWKENASKLDVKKTYPLNPAQLNQWIEEQGDECSKKFATIVKKYARHVSFAEFKNAMNRLGNAIKLTILDKKYDRVVLVLDAPISKSNTWAALLLYPYIREYITDIVNNIYNVKDIMNTTTLQKILVIVPDDASYSGRQLGEGVKDFSARLNYPNVDIFIAVPYMGKLAYQTYFRECKHCIVSNTTELIPTLQENLEAENYPCIPQVKWNGYLGPVFQYWEGQIPIYFDHKLADGLSTLQKVFALGPIFTRDVGKEEQIPHSLIDSCESTYNDPPRNIYEYIGDITSAPEFNEHPEKLCPPPYYKLINYTFKGVPLSQDTILSDYFKKLVDHYDHYDDEVTYGAIQHFNLPRYYDYL